VSSSNKKYMKRFLSLIQSLAIVLVAGQLVACQARGDGTARLEKAEESHAAGDFSRAEIGYKNLLKSDEGNVRALSGLGRIWLARGVSLEAVRLLSLARDRAPEDVSVRAGFASTLFASGYVVEARQEAVAVLRGDPELAEAMLVAVETSVTEEQFEETAALLSRHPLQDDADVLVHRAMLLLRQDDRVSARELAERALAVAPGNASAHLVLGRAHWLDGARDEAVAASGRAVELASDYSLAKVEHAVLLIGNGRVRESEAFLKKCTDQVPDFLPGWRMRAEIARQKEDREEAQRLVSRVLAISPFDLEGGLIQIELWLMDGDADRAVKLGRSLKAVHPPRASLEFGLARAYLIGGNSTPVRESLERALALDPAHEGATLLLSRQQLADGDGGKAVELLQGFLALRPGSIPAQSMLVEAYQKSGLVGEATRLLEQRIRNGGDDFTTHLQLGVVHRSAGKPVEARAAFIRAEELAPSQLWVIGQLVALDITEGKLADAHRRLELFLAENPESGGGHLLRAAVYFEEKKWEESEKSALAAINADPRLVPAYGLLVRIHSARGDIDRVVAELERLLLQAPHDHGALLRLGTLRQAQGNDDEARRNYERVLAIHPESVPALNNLAMILAKEGADLAMAADLAARARSAAPGDPAVADTMGWIHYLQGDYRRALSLLKQAVEGSPDDPEVSFHLGMAAAMMDEPELARKSLARSISAEVEFPGRELALERLKRLEAPLDVDDLRLRLEKSPGDPVDRVRLGEALAERGDVTAAVTEFLAALSANPNLVKAHMGLAQIYSAVLGEPSKALECVRRARELAPGDPAVAEWSGRIAYRTGDHTWAHSLFSESIAGGRDGPELLQQTAWSAYALGRVGEARELMQRAAASEDNPEAEEARRFLSLTGANPPGDSEPMLAEDTDDVPAMMAKAAVLEEQGESGRAVTLYKKVLEVFPKFAPAKIDLARLLIDEDGRLDEVKSYLFQARQSMKDEPDLLALSARVSFLEGDHAHAVQLFEQARGAGGKLDSMGNYVLGLSYFQMEQIDKAEPLLKKALAGGLREPEAARARAALAGELR